MSADMKLSVVVPFEDSGRGLENLAGSLFCRAQGVELLLCGDADENILGRLRASAPRHADPRLLAIPASCRRVAACNPN